MLKNKIQPELTTPGSQCVHSILRDDNIQTPTVAAMVLGLDRISARYQYSRRLYSVVVVVHCQGAVCMYVGVVLLKCLFISAARPDRSSIQYLSACTKYVHPFFILFYLFFFFFLFSYDFLGFILQSRSICQAQSVKKIILTKPSGTGSFNHAF